MQITDKAREVLRKLAEITYTENRIKKDKSLSRKTKIGMRMKIKKLKAETKKYSPTSANENSLN